MASDIDNFYGLTLGKGRLLGFDVGRKTLGVSISDNRWILATPGIVMPRGKLQAMVQQLASFIKGEKVAGIIVGLPKSLDGSLNVMTKSIFDFMVAFQKIFPYPYLFWDERFSTQAAERSLKEGRFSIAKRNQRIDALAASFILQNFLDYCAFKANKSAEPF